MAIENEILEELKKLNEQISNISSFFLPNSFPNQKNVINTEIEKNILQHFTKRKIKTNDTTNQNLLREKYHKQKA
jgi:hypothetical protein